MTAPVLVVSSRGSRRARIGASRNDGDAHHVSTANGRRELRSVDRPPKREVSSDVSQKKRHPATSAQTGHRHPFVAANQSPPAQAISHRTTMTLNPPPIDPAR